MRRFRCNLSVLISAALLALPSFGAGHALAQSGESEVLIERERQRLDNINSEIESGEQRQRDLEDRVDTLREETIGLGQRLVDMASSLLTQEGEVTALETRLGALEEQERAATEALEARREELTRTVSALVRLSRQPPESLIARPGETLDTVRAASLLAALIPAIQVKAEELGEEIIQVSRLREQIEGDRLTLDGDLRNLDERREELRAMMTASANARGLNAREEALLGERIQRLASEAETVQELIASLEEEIRARALIPMPAGGPVPEFSLPAGSLLFSSARGSLPLPVQGELVQGFGDVPSNRPDSMGITLVTRSFGQVIAPWDGQVVYSGTFRDYGQLLIIAHGEGYHTLLAGMVRIDARVGQWLLAGEPVGEMGSVGAGATRLYVELRRNGEPIDPVPWLMASS